MENGNEIEKKTTAIGKEKIKQILLDHINKIKKSVIVWNESDENSYDTIVSVYPNMYAVNISYIRKGSEFQIGDRIDITLRCRNIYNYVNNPNDYSDTEDFASVLYSCKFEDDIMREIDEQLEKVE
jgi:ferredoxin-fold anticodon binding domain-containing protein